MSQCTQNFVELLVPKNHKVFRLQKKLLLAVKDQNRVVKSAASVKNVHVAKRVIVHVVIAMNLFALIVKSVHVLRSKRSALKRNLMIAHVIIIVTISRAVIQNLVARRASKSVLMIVNRAAVIEMIVHVVNTKRRNQIAMHFVAKIAVQRNSIVV